jgi:hypothetical protein
MYLTPDQAERDSATGFRMIFELIGVLMAAGIQGFKTNKIFLNL